MLRVRISHGVSSCRDFRPLESEMEEEMSSECFWTWDVAVTVTSWLMLQYVQLPQKYIYKIRISCWKKSMIHNLPKQYSDKV